MPNFIIELTSEEKNATVDLFDIMLDNLKYVRKNGSIVTAVPQTHHIAEYVRQLTDIRDKVANS